MDRPRAGAAALLAHSLSPRLVGLVSVGGVIGAGLFVGSAAMIHRAGPVVLASYLAAGLLVVLVMRMLGEMSVAHPGAGSFIAHIRLGLGGGAGFMAGWAYWLLWAVTAGSEVIAGAALLRHLTGLGTGAGEALLVGGTTLANLVSTRLFGRMEGALSLLKLAAIGLFLAIGALALAGLFGDGPAIGNLVGQGGFAPAGWWAALTVLPILVQTLTGFEIATVAAAESTDPVRAVTRAASGTVIRVVLFYVGSIFLILCIVPWRELAVGVSPFAASLGRLGLPGADTVMSVIVLVAVVSTLNSALYAASRVMLEMAVQGDAPAWLARTNARSVPTQTVLVGIAVEIVIALCATLSPNRVYLLVLSCSGAFGLVCYLLAACAQIRLRRAMIRAGQQPALRMWWFPGLSYAVVAAIILTLLGMMLTAETRFELAISTASLVAIGVGGILFRRPARVATGLNQGSALDPQKGSRPFETHLFEQLDSQGEP